MDVILRRRQARAGEIGLFPVDDTGQEIVNRLKENRDVECDVRQRRNPRHHRLYWAIIRFLRMHAVDKRGNSLFQYTDDDAVAYAIKMATGTGRKFKDVETGKLVFVPKSTSWASMDQTEFNGFFDRACIVIAQRYLPEGSTSESVRKELLEMIGEPYGGTY